MAVVSAPYGLAPINLLGGQAYAGSTRQIPIASGYAVSIQNGDPVVVLSTGATRGSIQRFNATTAATTVTAAATMIGVFLGCTYTDAVLGRTFRNGWLGGTVATDAMAYVVDDPDALFLMQADGVVPATALGCNASMIQKVAGSGLVNGNLTSGVALQASSIAATATLPIRIVDFQVGPTSAVGDAFTDCIVRINTHFHRTATGTAAT